MSATDSSDWIEKEGLLEGTEGRARQARRELLEQLAEDGVSVEELRQAVEEDRLALLPVERVLEGEGSRYSAAEVAERAGLDLDFFVREHRNLGLPVPDSDEKAFGEEDVEAATRLKALRDSGLPEDGIDEIARVFGVAMSQLAAANRSLIGEALVKPGDTERDVGLRFADAARELGPLVGATLEYAFKLHLREQIRHDVIGRAELQAGAPGTQEVSVCFADLVGFTQLGEELPPEELGGVTGRLGKLAAEVTAAPVRLVKMIGDAAMMVSTDGVALLEASLRLVDAAEGEGEDFPMLRAGVARGSALARAGDWYGRPVNIASRVTAIARPGSVLASREAVDAAGDDFHYSFAGERRLKGIEGDVELFRVRREPKSSGRDGRA
jgi:adenylate cyclase